MISIEKLKIIDPSLSHLSDEELEAVRKSLYDLGNLIFDDYHEEKFGSKNPVGVLEDFKDENKLKA